MTRKARMQRQIENLRATDRKARERAEWLLIRHYASDAVEPLIEACRSEDPEVRFRAVWVLGYSKKPEAFETILNLCDDPDEAVRYDAVLALGKHGDPRSAAALFEIALADDDRPAYAALSELGPSCLSVVLPHRHSADTQVQRVVEDICAQLADQGLEARYVIEEALEDPDETILLIAADSS